MRKERNNLTLTYVSKLLTGRKMYADLSSKVWAQDNEETSDTIQSAWPDAHKVLHVMGLMTTTAGTHVLVQCLT